MNEMADEKLLAAAQTLLRDGEIAGKTWTGVAAVFSVEDGDTSAFGYLYNGPKWEWFSPADYDAFSDAMQALRKATLVPGDKPWVACLMQITRADMGLNCDFEYEDPERWVVRSSNMEQLIEEFRPPGA